MATAPQAEVEAVTPLAAHDCLHPDQAIDQKKQQPHGSEQQQVPVQLLEEKTPFQASSWPQGQVYMMMYKRTDPDTEVGGVHHQGPVHYAVSDRMKVFNYLINQVGCDTPPPPHQDVLLNHVKQPPPSPMQHTCWQK